MKTLNTIYLWLMLAACVLALAGCVEEKVSGTGEGGNISVKMNVNARGGSDIQAEMENAVKFARICFYRTETNWVLSWNYRFKSGCRR